MAWKQSEPDTALAGATAWPSEILEFTATAPANALLGAASAYLAANSVVFYPQ
jgi:hypothetical protein